MSDQYKTIGKRAENASTHLRAALNEINEISLWAIENDVSHANVYFAYQTAITDCMTFLCDV